MAVTDNLFHTLFNISPAPAKVNPVVNLLSKFAQTTLGGKKPLHSALLRGRSGRGLSTTLLNAALDSSKPANSKPVFFFIDNAIQYKYLLALIQAITRLKPDPKQYPFIQGESLRADAAVEGSTKTAEQLKADTEQARIIFITKKALASLNPQLQELAQHHGVRNFYYDDIHTLRYNRENGMYTHLMDLMSKLEGHSSILATINYPWHQNLRDDVFANNTNLASLFPSRIDVNKEVDLGLEPANGRTSAIPFCPIAEGVTIAKVLATDSNQHLIQKALTDTMVKIKDCQPLEKKTVVIKTTSPEACELIEKNLIKLELGDDWQIKNTINPSGIRFLTEVNNTSNRILVTTSLLEHIHLPPGTITDFVYFDAATSTTDLARQLSIATTDPNTRIYFLKPKDYNGALYKFPDLSYRQPKLRLSTSHERGVGPTLVHQAFIDDAITAALIKDEGLWQNFLQGLLARATDGQVDHWKDNLIQILQKSHRDLDRADIEDVINGHSYDPKLFREFLTNLLNIRSIQNAWATCPAINRQVPGSSNELTVRDLVKAFPRLTGVFNLDEARMVLEDFHPLWQFTLDFIGGFPDLTGFSNRDRLAILLDLMSYLKIDKNSLLTELQVSSTTLMTALEQRLGRDGLHPDHWELATFANHLSEYYLLANLFPQLDGLTESLAIENSSDASTPYSMAITVRPKAINFIYKEGANKL